MLLPRERASFVFPNVSISQDEVQLSSLIHVVLYLNVTDTVKADFTPVHLTSNTSLVSVLQQNVFSNHLQQYQTRTKYS